MRRNVLVAVLILGMAGALGAQPSPEPEIAGWFELRPKEPGGKTPFAVQGWALAACGPAEVRVEVDGRELRRAAPSFAWPGVAEKYPGVAGAGQAGFWIEVDPTLFAAGEHRLAVAVEACGTSRELGGAAFRTAPPTRASIAWPLLALLLGALPFAAGRLLARRREETGMVPALELRIVLLLAALAATVVAARHWGGSVIAVDGGLFAPLANWDGRYYLTLARDGYTPEQPAAYAYFPLYPAVLHLLMAIPLPPPLLGSLFNAALTLVLVVLLRRLYPGRDRGIALFVCSPFAFFFVATYTEPLALVLAAGFLLALARERPGRAFALGALAGLTRISSLALALVALDHLRQRRYKLALVSLTAPAAGVAIWMAWLWRSTGDPLKFLAAQTRFGRATSFHPGRLLDVLAAAARGSSAQTWWEIFFLFLVLTGAAALIAKGRWGEGAYSAAAVLLPLATLRLTSLNRYSLAAFPVFVLLGGLLPPKTVFRVVLAVELALLFYHAARFGQQYWVG